MPKFIDLTGRKFERLTALRISGRDKRNQILWECRCDCGNVKIIRGGSLTTGHAKSCGCFSVDSSRTRFTKHGLSSDPTHKIWADMNGRCFNKNHHAYHNYGGRGITVCERWRTFENFRSDMGDRPTGLEIDRINNDGNYEPGNCRWATIKQQCNNTRCNHKISYNGKTMNMVEWAELLKIPKSTLKNRIRRGWPIERALTTPAL